MPLRTWHSDAYGLYNLHADGHHWWIAPRQPYCDRGHWEIGHQGAEPDRDHRPARYFHRLDSAIAEVERWHRRGEGTFLPLRAAFSLETLPTHERAHWAVEGDGWVRTERGMRLTVHPLTTEAGPLWRLDATGVDGLDAADAFPRDYLHPTVALDEAICFAAWRIHRQPTEVPTRIQRPDQRMAGDQPSPRARRRP